MAFKVSGLPLFTAARMPMTHSRVVLVRTASTSNLPGPATELQLAGSPIDNFVFFVPPQRTIGHFITVLSYNGKVTFGMTSDEVRMLSYQLQQTHWGFFPCRGWYRTLEPS